ncbi:hypothetical protein [Sulfolobus super-elliptical virus]|nr:hypothetical protein [Sulfolobus super-elliptical virus]
MREEIVNSVIVFSVLLLSFSIILTTAYTYASLSSTALFSYNFTTLTSVPSTIVPTTKYVHVVVNGSGLFVENGTAEVGLPYPVVANISAVNGKIILDSLEAIQNSSGIFIYNNNVLENKSNVSSSVEILEMGGKIIVGVYGTKTYYATSGQYGLLQMEGQFKTLTVYEQEISGAEASESVTGSGNTLVNAGSITAYSNQLYIQLQLSASTPENVTILLMNNQGKIEPLVNSTTYAPYILPNGTTVKVPVITVDGNNINVIGSGPTTSTQSYEILVGLPSGQTATLSYGQALDISIGPGGISIGTSGTSSSSSSSITLSSNTLYYALIGFAFLVIVILVIVYAAKSK